MKLEIDHRNRNKRKKLLVETIQQATKKIMGHDKIKEECWKYLGITNNESTTIHNLWDAAKAIIIQAVLQKQEKSELNNLTPKKN